MIETHNSLIGKKLGKYEVQSIIGVGAMTTSYLGYQSPIDRYVVIKVLPPYPGQDSDFAEHFEREAQAIARLQQPHILSMTDFGSEADIFYLVMPYLTGGSLRNLMDEQRLEVTHTSEILWYIASAIDYAHRMGVVHRDIKPDNILLDGVGHPLLTDFGIAKLVENNTHFMASGGFLGTPAYMAPEQGRGITQIDRRVDIYALGVLAFEMLTRQQPYMAETPTKVMFRHVSDPVPSLRSIDASFTAELDSVIKKALAKEPADRYLSAVDFAQAFSTAASGGLGSDTARISRSSYRIATQRPPDQFPPARQPTNTATPLIGAATLKKLSSTWLFYAALGILFLFIAVIIILFIQ